jgi:hypothetical protein
MNDQLFAVIEHNSFFAVRHNPSRDERPMGDGVDTLFNEDGTAMSPGTEEFRKTWEEVLNADWQDTLAAYFPHHVSV